MPGLIKSIQQQFLWLMLLSVAVCGVGLRGCYIEKRITRAGTHCDEKTRFHFFKNTKGCKIINNFGPPGQKWPDDCGRLIWAYSTIQCGEYRYFGWQAWNNSTDKRNVWINGNQYYRSCRWPRGIPDEELKQEHCRYDFMKDTEEQ